VTFGDAQDFVDRLDPIVKENFLAKQRRKDFTERSVKPLGFAEEGACASRIVLRKCEQLGAAFRGNDSGNQKKTQELLPGEVRGEAQFVEEIDGKAATDETRRCG